MRRFGTRARQVCPTTGLVADVVAVRALAVGALAVIALAVGSSGCSTPGDDPGPALAVDPGSIYAQMCARCHGVDGRGDPELRKTMPVRDFSDAGFQERMSHEEIARTIMAGKNQMPAFGSLLSVPKIQALSGFVKRLGRSVPGGHAPDRAR